MRLAGIVLVILGALGLAWTTWYLPGHPPKYLHRKEVERFRLSARRISLGLGGAGLLMAALG